MGRRWRFWVRDGISRRLKVASAFLELVNNMRSFGMQYVSLRDFEGLDDERGVLWMRGNLNGLCGISNLLDPADWKVLFVLPFLAALADKIGIHSLLTT